MFGKKYKKIVKVEGLTCPNCAKKMESKLSEIDSVSKVETNLQDGVITINSKKEINNENIESKFEGTDYKVLYIK